MCVCFATFSAAKLPEPCMLLGCSGSCFDCTRIFPQEEGLSEISKWGLQKVDKVSCIKITNMFVCDCLLETEEGK